MTTHRFVLILTLFMVVLAVPSNGATDGAQGAAPDPSLHRGLQADAPQMGDEAEPPGLQQSLLNLGATRQAARTAADDKDRSSTQAKGGIPGSPWPANDNLLASDVANDVSAQIDPAYLEYVTTAITGFGDNADGWRPGGSPANETAADWLAEEMNAVGLKAVRKLPVPIDRWVFNGADVAVDGGPTFPASSWGGVPGTPPGGIHAEVLDLGQGRQADYDNLGMDVTGKIVLVDWEFGDLWVNRHGHQATLEGAAAVIFYTGTTAAGAFYNKRDDSLFAFDGTYNDDWVPFVFVTRNAANDLRARIAAGQTFVTLTSNIELTRAEDGGVGHNVVGMIPGTDLANEVIIFTGHHDAWFRGAADDATAMAAMLGIAKAVRDSGYRPRRTLAFLATTSEEYGYTDAYYDWLIGAWYAITKQRTEWQHRGALALDFELLGTGDPGERLLIRVHSELFDLAQQKLTADPARTPHGTLIQNTVWANADHYTLTAGGIPGLYFNTLGFNYLTTNYHTDHDTVERIDFEYLKNNLEVINDIWITFDHSTLPLLDFVAKATEAEARIDFTVDGTKVEELPGTDLAAQSDLEAAVARFAAAAASLETLLTGGVPKGGERRISNYMRHAERILLQELVALDVFDQYIMPHQQVQRDATRMKLAIDALQAGNPVAAQDFVRRTSLTSSGRHFAYESYAAELARHDPDYERLQWGAQAHLAPYVDVWQEYHSITDKIALALSDPADYASEIASLQAKLAPVYGRLNERLGTMRESFDRASLLLERAAR